MTPQNLYPSLLILILPPSLITGDQWADPPQASRWEQDRRGHWSIHCHQHIRQTWGPAHVQNQDHPRQWSVKPFLPSLWPMYPSSECLHKTFFQSLQTLSSPHLRLYYSSHVKPFLSLNVHSLISPPSSLCSSLSQIDRHSPHSRCLVQGSIRRGTRPSPSWCRLQTTHTSGSRWWTKTGGPMLMTSSDSSPLLWRASCQVWWDVYTHTVTVYVCMTDAV